jgi:hypothetical protein
MDAYDTKELLKLIENLENLENMNDGAKRLSLAVEAMHQSHLLKAKDTQLSDELVAISTAICALSKKNDAKAMKAPLEFSKVKDMPKRSLRMRTSKWLKNLVIKPKSAIRRD